MRISSPADISMVRIYTHTYYRVHDMLQSMLARTLTYCVRKNVKINIKNQNTKENVLLFNKA